METGNEHVLMHGNSSHLISVFVVPFRTSFFKALPLQRLQSAREVQMWEPV